MSRRFIPFIKSHVKAYYEKWKPVLREQVDNLRKEITPTEVGEFVLHTAAIIGTLHFLGAYVFHVSSVWNVY
jgi:hypothetical protein